MNPRDAQLLEYLCGVSPVTLRSRVDEEGAAIDYTVTMFSINATGDTLSDALDCLILNVARKAARK